MPELMFDTVEAVPEAFRSIAAEKDGKFAINVVPKTELDEFRNRNIEVSKDRDTKASILGRLQTEAGFDPEKADEFLTSYKDLRTIKQQVDDGKLVADSSLEEAISSRTGQMKTQYDHQINELSNKVKNLGGENENLKGQINQGIVDRNIMDAVNDPNSGALPNATRAILREAYDLFSVDEHGELVAKDRRGNILYGTDGATSLTPKEWLKNLEESSPFFFKSSQGGGAGGGGGGNGGTLTPAQLAAMTPEQKMDYGRKHNMNG